MQSHCHNESLQIVSKKLLGKTISDLRESIEDEQEDVRCLSPAATIIRRELLGIEPWKFTGMLTGFQTPTNLATFLKWVLIGTKNTSVAERYDEHVQKSESLIVQHIITNLKTDRQARYKVKSDFYVVSKTPLSIGLALAVHKRTRSKNLVNVLSNLQLGANYKQTVNLEKWIAFGVAERMKTTGWFCLPPFVMKDKSIFFAADNIDFLEDTADGQNTLHGTLLVISQRAEDGALQVNEPLEIPNDVCTQADVQPNYLKAPEIRSKATRFETYDFQPDRELLKKYELRDLTWLFACYAHRERTFGDSGSVLEPEDGMDQQETQDCESEPRKDEYNAYSTDENTSQFESAKTSEPKPGRTDMMPTWGATNSLLIQSTTGFSSLMVNTGIMTTLLCRPSTDYGVLYTVLCLAQGISAVVVGPNRKTIITLDLDLYERGLKIQSSNGN